MTAAVVIGALGWLVAGLVVMLCWTTSRILAEQRAVARDLQENALRLADHEKRIATCERAEGVADEALLQTWRK